MEIRNRGKLYNGMVAVRDYEIKECIEKQEDIKIIIDDAYMIIPWQQLDKGKVYSQKIFKTKNERTYRLLNFRWIPVSEKQQGLAL